MDAEARGPVRGCTDRRYEYSLNPAIKGRIYIFDTCDETLGEMICLIDREC